MQIFELENVVPFLHSNKRTVVLIVNRNSSIAISVADTLARKQCWVLKCVATDLATILLETPPRDRADRSIEWINYEANFASPIPLVLTGIDVLFEPALEIDVPRMLVSAARRTPILVAWPGDVSKGIVSYAIPDHARYKSFKWSEVCVVRASA